MEEVEPEYLIEPAGGFYETLTRYIYDYCCLVDYPCDKHKELIIKETKWK